MKPKKIEKLLQNIIPPVLEEKININILTEEEEALKVEQEEMGSVAKDMWRLMQLQQASTFYTMRKFKTLAPYLIRLEDVLILNVTKLCQNGTTFEAAKEIYLKEMMDELGLV